MATAEDELEEALEAVLDAECAGGDGSEGEDRLMARRHSFISGGFDVFHELSVVLVCWQ